MEKEDIKSYIRQIKDSLDYIVDGQNVILSQGHWMEFNEDYINQLNEYVDGVEIEPVEDDILETDKKVEVEFNESMVSFGYVNADKDFSKIKVFGVPIEAWDLQKKDTVYAVKIGTPQKVGYVCDQAINTLELIKKKVNVKKLDIDFRNYCVWIILNRANKINKISEVKSIIFKQKIESWARKCYEYGIIPKIKISYLKNLLKS